MNVASGNERQRFVVRDVGLSILVPVYQGAATLPILVAALSQLSPFGGLEIVLVNDGSPDGSADVCRSRFVPPQSRSHTLNTPGISASIMLS